MDSRRSGGVHMLRLDPPEDVIDTLAGYLASQHVRAGFIHGIGALRDVVIGAYDLADRSYVRSRLEGDWELLGMSATVSMLDGAPFVHPHVVLGDETGCVRGGHLFEGRIAVTGEFVLVEADIDVTRELDEGTGLKLWRFHGER